MRRYNLNEPGFVDDETDPDGYKTAYDRIGPKVGGDKLGATHYLIRPGQHLCPYHYEYAEEEWLLVLEGRPSVRHPGGTDELREGVRRLAVAVRAVRPRPRREALPIT